MPNLPYINSVDKPNVSDAMDRKTGPKEVVEINAMPRRQT